MDKHTKVYAVKVMGLPVDEQLGVLVENIDDAKFIADILAIKYPDKQVGVYKSGQGFGQILDDMPVSISTAMPRPSGDNSAIRESLLWFAVTALALLENDKDWGPHTMDALGCAALDASVGQMDDEGYFQATDAVEQFSEELLRKACGGSGIKPIYG